MTFALEVTKFLFSEHFKSDKGTADCKSLPDTGSSRDLSGLNF